MRAGALIAIAGGLIVATTAWAAAAAGTSSSSSAAQRLSALGGGLPDPDLLDGSKEKAEERQDYGMLGEFDVAGQKQQDGDQKGSADNQQKGQGGQGGTQGPDGGSQQGGGDPSSQAAS